MAGRGQVKALDSSVARLGSEVIPKLTSLRERILLQSQDHVIKSLFFVSFVASLTHWSHLSNCNLLPMQDYKRSAGSDLLSIHSECALEMSKKNGGNQKINSINICPECCCSALQIHQKQKQHRDCSVFSEQREGGGGSWRAEVILREHSAGGVSALLGSQNQSWKQKKVLEPNSDRSAVTADQAVPHRLLLPPRLHSVPPKQRPEREGGEGGGVVANTIDATIRSWTTTFTEERREKKKIIVCKEKGLWMGGTHCNRYPHALQEGYKKRIPIPGQVSDTSQHATFNWSLY